jgi:two-component system response regulator HydG
VTAPGSADAESPAANDGRVAGWDPARVVLVVDDEASIVESLDKIFKREGFTVLTATNGAAGLELLRRHRVGVLLSDLMMPGTTGMDLLRAAKTVAPETEVVLMTAYGTVETAVDAMKEGAYDFVAKPLKRAHVVRVVRNALEKQSLVTENRALKAQLTERRRRAIIGTSLPWRRTMDIVHQAAPSEATVLLARRERHRQGAARARAARELARAPRARSSPSTAPRSPSRSSRASCSATRRARSPAPPPRATAASRRRRVAPCSSTRSARSRATSRSSSCACCRRARSSASAAAASRAGSTSAWSPRPTSISPRRSAPAASARICSTGSTSSRSTCRRCATAARTSPILAQHFVSLYAEKNGKAITGCTPAALTRLADYPWPGNVRELENAIERAVVLTRGNSVDEDALPLEIRHAAAAGAPGLTFAVGTPLAEIEMRVIRETLRHTRGDKRLAATLLGIATRTIYRRLAESSDPVDRAAPRRRRHRRAAIDPTIEPDAGAASSRQGDE